MTRLTYWNEEYNCWSYHCASGDAAKKLAAYEDAEEKGHMSVFPCKPGDTIYGLQFEMNETRPRISAKTVYAFTIFDNGYFTINYSDGTASRSCDLGYTWFLTTIAAEERITVLLTRESAEKQLELEGKA